MMANGRDACSWNHTSHVLAALLNSNPFHEGDPYTARQLNPYIDNNEDEETGPEMDAKDLAYLLCGAEAVELFARADRQEPKP